MKTLSILLLCLLLLVSCDKDNKAQTIPVECTFQDDFGVCFPTMYLSSKNGYVFNNDNTYRNFQDSIRNKNFGCDSSFLPPIDFSIYTLIGIQTENDCSPNVIDKKIINDITNKLYIYTITIKRVSSTCKMKTYTMNWALVNKIPLEYKIIFKTKII